MKYCVFPYRKTVVLFPLAIALDDNMGQNNKKETVELLPFSQENSDISF